MDKRMPKRSMRTTHRALALAAVLAAGTLASRPAAAAEAVGTSTLTDKLIMGYQGWFACPSDNSGRGWFHWMAGNAPTVDYLPDVSELPKGERCLTSLTGSDGQPVAVFSSRNADTVDRHFAWMETYGLDGVALQRFATQLQQPKMYDALNDVLDNVRKASEKHGRAFFIMYDLSGLVPDKIPDLIRDWEKLEGQGLTGSKAYLHHRGHPLLGLWGLGFKGRPLRPQDGEALIAGLTKASESHGGITILGGVPAGWRTSTRDAEPDTKWQEVWPKLAVISPWSVGRYHDDASADTFRKETLEPDLKEARKLGADYMPVVFPGFSWANQMRIHKSKAVSNQIPRNCGRFYWKQVSNTLGSGVDMIYNAMFDEVDEGTAMFKLQPAAAQVTGMAAGSSFVTLDVDGCKLPSDWYLRLAGAATAALHAHHTPSPELPFQPPAK